jgi:hypothetical protein
MESEGSLPCSQQPITCRYPSSDQSSPCPQYFLIIHFNIILPSLPWSSQRSFAPPKALLTRTCHMPRPSHPLFDHKNSTRHEAPYCAVVSSILSACTSEAFSTPNSQTPSVFNKRPHVTPIQNHRKNYIFVHRVAQKSLTLNV